MKPSALPASAQIVRTADLTFPPVAMPPSMKPNAGQHSVAFIDASTGFLARGGQAFGTDAGGAYLPEAGIERTSDGGKTVDGLGGLGRLRQLDWIPESRSRLCRRPSVRYHAKYRLGRPPALEGLGSSVLSRPLQSERGPANA